MLTDRIGGLLGAGKPVAVAIDGPCGSGKSTLAGFLRSVFPGSVIFRMDDFFLQPAQRTPSRLAAPGGNIDHERFLREVLLPLRSSPSFVYHAFDCRSARLSPVHVQTPALSFVEGSYSMHPLLRTHYDYSIFITVGPATQRSRLLKRCGAELFMRFETEWIPMENHYFRACRVKEACDAVLSQAALAALLSGPPP